MIVAGVDDAGRGSVLGPLVIGGVSIDESRIPDLVRLGVRDSKALTPKKRQELYKEIRKISKQVVWQSISPRDIDRVVFSGQKLFRLNYLEAQVMASVLNKLEYDLAYVDCCDTNQKRFGYLISDMIAGKHRKKFTVGEKNPLFNRIRSEHHADRNYPVVSAASIVAKVTRDTSIKKLHDRHGMFGSGYPSDQKTIAYLNKALGSPCGLPSFTRLSWQTVRRIQEKTPNLGQLHQLGKELKP